MRLPVRPWMLASAIWIMPALFAALDVSVQWRLRGSAPPTWRHILFAAGDWLIYAVVTPVIFWASAKWPVRSPKVARHAWLHLGFALVFCLGWALSAKVMDVGLAYLFSPEEFVTVFTAANRARLYIEAASWIFAALPFGVIVYACMSGMAHAFAFFAESYDREVTLARMSEQLAGARFAALEAQVNPHFLFNTLNTMVVRARDGDSQGTVHMIEQLSEMLRRTLARHRTPEVTLAEELDLVRQYLAIEEARFPDRLKASVDVPESVHRASVPSFAVQHLVENAIRHGVARRTEAGRVDIVATRERTAGADELVVEVRDEGPGLPTAFVAPTGRGLAHTRERLRMLFGDRASLSLTSAADCGAVATLRVPYREMPEDHDQSGR